MKKIFLILIVFLSLNSYSQEWHSNLPKNKIADELTLHDYQNAFNKYWDSYDVKNGYYTNAKGEKQKAPGWKLFKRWEYYWESRVNQTSGKFPTTSAIDEYKKWEKRNPSVNMRSLSGNWQSMGPSSSGGGYAGLGRLNCVAFHPNDNNSYWVV